eukprot:SAG31_NODE_9308_length_1300_cov_1.683597_1_plen_215_part_01
MRASRPQGVLWSLAQTSMAADALVVVIGIGSIANKYAAAIARIDGVQLFAGCCRTYDGGKKITCSINKPRHVAGLCLSGPLCYKLCFPGPRRAKGDAFAAKFGCKYFEDYEDMLREFSRLHPSRTRFAIIATPSGAHLEPALACCAAKVNILCEKPLEISVERTDKMISAAKEAGVTLGGVFQSRFMPELRRIHAAASTGEFGSLSAVSGCVPWW